MIEYRVTQESSSLQEVFLTSMVKSSKFNCSISLKNMSSSLKMRIATSSTVRLLAFNVNETEMKPWNSFNVGGVVGKVLGFRDGSFVTPGKHIEPIFL